MKTKKYLLMLVALTIMTSCRDLPSNSTSGSIDPSISEGTSDSGTGWVNPGDLWRPAEHINLTPAPAYTGNEWKSIDFTKSGEELKMAINTYMWSKFVKVDYNAALAAVKIMDVDPEKPNYVLSIYDLKSHHNGSFTNWNREHAFPQSKLSKDSNDTNYRTEHTQPNIATDVANIFASDSDLNTARSNHSFAEWNFDDNPELYYNLAQVNTAGQKVDSILRRGYWSPTPLVRGEIARSQLYMLLMYPENCTLVENFAIEDMLRWDLNHAPTVERDLQRQIGIQQFQKVRNPFIDNRTLGCQIWGDTNAKTRTLCADYI